MKDVTVRSDHRAFALSTADGVGACENLSPTNSYRPSVESRGMLAGKMARSKQPSRSIALTVASWRLWLMALFAGLAGCSQTIGIDIKPAVDKTPVRLPDAQAYVAGAARIDITPMPGYPMGGHGPGGTTARGYWLRLYAHAIYLEDGRGRSLSLVSCDLWSMPAGLADRVAEIVGRNPNTKHIGREEILLAATHTHQSPGNFSTSKPHNMLAAHRVGFDKQLFEFLAHRIAKAIVDAHNEAQQRAYQRRFADVQVGRVTARQVFWNRSLDAFLLNRESRDILELPWHRDLPPGRGTAKERPDDAYRAVDPAIMVLQVIPRDRPHAPLALAAFLAVHPETMPHTTQVYSSDLFGIASRYVAFRLAPSISDPEKLPVVAIFNGAEGDISADWWPQGRITTDELGRSLGRWIMRASREERQNLFGRIESRFKYVKVAGRRFPDPDGRPDPNGRVVYRQTAKDPMMGIAAFGGGEDGRTFFHDAGWVEGETGHLVKSRRIEHQGSKHPALDLRIDSYSLPWLVRNAPKLAFLDLARITEGQLPVDEAPQYAPIGIHQIGRLTLAALPGEFTFTMGRRIRRALSRTVRSETDPKPVVLVGLANEYLSYFVTPEEYEAQYYEGAFTLYGPASGPLIQHELMELSSGPPTTAFSRHHRYDSGYGKNRKLRDLGGPRHAHDDGLEEVLEQLRPGQPNRDLPYVTWFDIAPTFPRTPSVASISQVTPQVHIEWDGRGGWQPLKILGLREDDRGTNIVTVNRKADRKGSQWVSIWMPPKIDLLERAIRNGVSFRFRVVRIDGAPEPPSSSFSLRRDMLYPQP